MELFFLFLVGVFCIGSGISNMRGNISTIHWHIRDNVTEENKIPFARLIGLDSIIVGTSTLVFGGFAIAAEKSENYDLLWVGLVITVIGYAIGLILGFYAVKKYNGHIF